MQALGLVWRDVDSISPDCEEVSAPREKPSHPGAQLTYENWGEKRNGFVVGRDLPSRPLAGVLRNLVIYEPVDSGADFRVRVAGTALVRRYGCDVTGLPLSQLYESHAFALQQTNMTKAANGAPVFFDVRLLRGGRLQLQYESLLLPVLSPDLRQNWVMGGVFYHDWVR